MRTWWSNGIYAQTAFFIDHKRSKKIQSEGLQVLVTNCSDLRHKAKVGHTEERDVTRTSSVVFFQKVKLRGSSEVPTFKKCLKPHQLSLFPFLQIRNQISPSSVHIGLFLAIFSLFPNSGSGSDSHTHSKCFTIIK